jgi:hypothetical protein
VCSDQPSSRIVPMIGHQHETIYWLGLRLEVPSDWQIVRHGLKPERGRLTFADRFAERLDLTWRKVPSEPDVESMVKDQRVRDDSEGSSSELRIPGWCGYRRTCAGESLVRAARYDAESKRLIEVVLVVEPRQGRSTKVDDRLLNQIRSAETIDQRQRLRAFDIDVTLRKSLRLCRATVEPANVTFAFAAADTRSIPTSSQASAVIRRMGMAASWYRGNALRLLERESPRVDFGRVREIRVNAHVATYAEGDASRTRVLRWFGRGAHRRAVAWLCEAENAVYHVATTSSDLAPLGPEALTVECCKGVAR